MNKPLALSLSVGLMVAATAPLTQADPVSDVLNGVLGPVSGALPTDPSAVTGLAGALGNVPALPSLPADALTLNPAGLAELPGTLTSMLGDDNLPVTPATLADILGALDADALAALGDFPNRSTLFQELPVALPSGGLAALPGLPSGGLPADLPLDPAMLTDALDALDPSALTDLLSSLDPAALEDLAGALPSLASGDLPLSPDALADALAGLDTDALSAVTGQLDPSVLTDIVASLPGGSLPQTPALPELPTGSLGALPSPSESLPVSLPDAAANLSALDPAILTDIIAGLDVSALDSLRSQIAATAVDAGVPAAGLLYTMTDPAILANTLSGFNAEQLVATLSNMQPEVILQLLQNQLPI